MIEQLKAAREARRKANEALVDQAAKSLSDTPLRGHPTIRPPRVDDDSDLEGSGVRRGPEERVCRRKEQAAEARQARKNGAARLKQTALGVSCYPESRKFRIDELRDELRAEGEDS